MEDIAYTLSEDRLLHPHQDQNDVSGYVIYYCWFGYFLLMAWTLRMIVSKNMKLLKSISATILDHIDFVISAVFVGYLFVICEFIAITVYLGDLYSTTFHLYLWIPTLFGFIIILLKVMKICYEKKCNWEKSDGLKLLISIFGMGMQLFLIYIYCYALPTFLLLLVYPTKIITVVAYLTTFIFVTSIVSSISIHLIIVYAKDYLKIGHCTCTCIMMIFNAISILVHPFIVFVAVIQFLYVLVLGQASAISAGPYTVLSLIPTAAISAASWLVRNKIFSSVDEKEDKKEPNKKNEDSATNSEAPTIVVNEDTPSNGSGNDQEVVINEDAPPLNDQELDVNEDNGNDQEVIVNENIPLNQEI